jgi:hypothetical protein
MESSQFEGLRGDPTRHWDGEALSLAIAALPPAPLAQGSVELMLARGPAGERELPEEVVLTTAGGMPGDRWVSDPRSGPEDQLATTRADFARLVANGQALDLHGDNLYLQLDISASNLPVGSLIRLGQALLRVTPKAHNGCKKWAQRFGLPAMKLNLSPTHRILHLAGIYLQVLEDGRVRVGDDAVIIERGPDS